MRYRLVGVVDENDKPIGSAHLKELYAKGLRYRTVQIFIRNPAGQILLQKRGLHVLAPGLWDLSAGGHVDVGEDYIEAAVRETQEETGITPTANQLHEVHRSYHETPVEEVDGGVSKMFTRIYLFDSDGGPHVQSSEVTEFKWMSRAELKTWIHDRPDDFTSEMRRSVHALESSLRD